jgi:hypothetical protein
VTGIFFVFFFERGAWRHPSESLGSYEVKAYLISLCIGAVAFKGG